jgi:hypothetical protein
MSVARVYALEAKYELLKVARMPGFAIPSIAVGLARPQAREPDAAAGVLRRENVRLRGVFVDDRLAVDCARYRRWRRAARRKRVGGHGGDADPRRHPVLRARPRRRLPT